MKCDALFDDLDHLTIATSFVEAVKENKISVVGVTIREIEMLTPPEIVSLIIHGRADGTVRGTF